MCEFLKDLSHVYFKYYFKIKDMITKAKSSSYLFNTLFENNVSQ